MSGSSGSIAAHTAFLQHRGLGADGFSFEVVKDFRDDLHVHHGSSWPTPRAFVWLVEYLTGIGVMAAPVPPTPRSSEEALVERHRRFLMAERGLAPQTVDFRVHAAVLLLTEHPVRVFDHLGAGDVSRFMTRHCRR